jgi:SAM-dependent methyltransferase
MSLLHSLLERWRGRPAPSTTDRVRVAVVGFYGTPDEQATLQKTFERFRYPDKELFLYPASREGELYSISNAVGELPVACINPDYAYSAEYLDDLVAACDDAGGESIWTADPEQNDGKLGDGSNPDLYRSLVPARVLRLLYSRENRHIRTENRGMRSRAVQVRTCAGSAVPSNGALPHGLHAKNGLYWLIDYAHRMDRRCIEAYLEFKGIDIERLALDQAEFVAALTPIQHRHLLFFLNTNIAGERAADYIAKHIDLATVKTAMDVGSGYGGLVKALLNRGCAATGLEIMTELMDLARINLAGEPADLIVGDFLYADIPADSYDLVTMTDVIEHVADVDRAIARTATVLRAGGYAYVKVPNYRFIDHVREDSHTGVFGITLLPHDAAHAYLRAVRNMKYSVGEYYDYDEYIRMFEKYGVTLVGSDNVQTPPEKAAELLASCRRTSQRWNEEVELDATMKAVIRNRADDYLAEFERRWKSQPDETFARDFMTSHWNLFFQKQPAA